MEHAGWRSWARGHSARLDTDPAALRDAAEILARAEADQAEADRLRGRFAVERIEAQRPDDRVAPRLESGEQVVARRGAALYDRRTPEREADRQPGLGGDLYVTSRRLILVGRVTLAFDLAEIEEVVLAGERLLVVLRDGNGFSLDVSRPRALRVEIAAARMLARA